MAAADACPGFSTHINAPCNIPTSYKILTCSRLLWGPHSLFLGCYFSMHELSGCCDSHSNHLHHCLLGTAFTCRIASACFFSHRACDYIKLWPDSTVRGSCFGSIFFNFSSPGRPSTTWPLRYVSKSPPTVHDINA